MAIQNELRRCMYEPAPEVLETGLMLEEASELIVMGERERASAVLREADMPDLLRLWNATAATRPFPQSRPPIAKELRHPRSAPRAPVLREMFERDGWHCRFCGVRVIEKRVREWLRREFPDVLRWGSKNTDYHTAVMFHMGTHDHVLPLSYGGSNDLGNLVTACWVCQFGRGEWLIEDVRVSDPREREPLRDEWDGLLRILK